MKEQNTYSIETLSKSIVFGEELLQDFAKEKNLEVEHLVILSLYRKLLEQLDGNYVLADHKLDSPSSVMIRAAFETYLAIKYILEVKNRIKDRAYCYYIGYVKSQQNAANELIAKPVEGISQEKLEGTLKLTLEILKKTKFQKVVEEWERTKTASKSKFEPKWYSLFNGPTSIKQIVEKVGDSEDYRFYSLLSQEAHAYQALNVISKIDLDDKPISFKPIRSEIEDASFQEEIARAFCTSSTHMIIQNFFPKFEKRFIEYGKDIGLLTKTFPYTYKPNV